MIMKKIIAQVLFMFVAIGVLFYQSDKTEVSAAEGTYYQSSLPVTAASDIEILSGNFEPTACGESGELDSQQVELINDELTFNVGASSSTGIATWFNNLTSGYNDASINGDRNSFDEVSEALDFAVSGNLTINLKTEEYASGIQITFEEIVIGHETINSTDKWWFGQTCGQHTRDCDGPNTVLIIGHTNNEETVYASVECNNISGNNVKINAITLVDEANSYANTLSDIESAFSSLSTSGQKLKLSGYETGYECITNHVQGYSQYSTGDKIYSIITHSVKTTSYAHIVIGETGSSQQMGFKTYMSEWRHPGGIQVIGDYLLVPTEEDSSAYVTVYDMRSLAVGELRRVESFSFSVSHKAGGIGITNYTDKNGNEKYVLLVANLDGDDSVYYIYQADATNGIETADFSYVGEFPITRDYQGFGLVTDSEDNIYLMGLYSEQSGLTYVDYAYLYQIDTTTWSLSSEIGSSHLKSSGVGLTGVHFRYGAGVYVTEDGSLGLYATERNISSSGTLTINYWN